MKKKVSKAVDSIVDHNLKIRRKKLQKQHSDFMRSTYRFDTSWIAKTPTNNSILNTNPSKFDKQVDE
jgi:hypothetical protein